MKRLHVPLAGFCALVLGGTSAWSQIVTMVDGNAVAQVNTSSQAGMFNWTVDGVNQLAQQWFWYAAGSSAPASIDTISAPSITTPTASSLTTLYTSPGFTVAVKYGLTGGLPGSGVSDISEDIRINNVSVTPLTFHFYQYSHFTLSGTPGDDQNALVLDSNPFGPNGFVKVVQVDSAHSLTETVVTPDANKGEAKPLGVTLAKLNGGLPVALDNTMASGPGNVTWALEWDTVINPGDTFLISKDKRLDVVPAPEPGVWALMSLGLGGLVMFGRRRKQAA